MSKQIFTFILLTLFGFWSCTNDIGEVNALTKKHVTSVEEGYKIKMLYSDSAVVKVRITADSIVRHVDRNYPRDVFPSGIFIEFLSESGRPTSWLEADAAVRDENKNTFTAQGNVKFYNKKNEKLLSTELVWDEDEGILYTDKFVTILQPEKGDTTYGIGFKSNVDFNIFEIKRSTSAVFRSQEFTKKLKD